MQIASKILFPEVYTFKNSLLIHETHPRGEGYVVWWCYAILDWNTDDIPYFGGKLSPCRQPRLVIR